MTDTATLAQAARTTDPRTTERPLTDLRPGDQINAVSDGDTWAYLGRPLLVIAAAGPIGAPDGPIGVRVHHRGEVEHVLYADRTVTVEAIRPHGYPTAERATSAAVKAAGWSTKGGCYYRPLPLDPALGYQTYAYTGVRGADQAMLRAIRWGWIVKLDGRWYLTGLSVPAARTVVAREQQPAPAPASAPNPTMVYRQHRTVTYLQMEVMRLAAQQPGGVFPSDTNGTTLGGLRNRGLAEVDGEHRRPSGRRTARYRLTPAGRAWLAGYAARRSTR